MKESYVPERGHALWIDFDPQRGHEQAGHRPAIVLSRRFYNESSGIALFCPVTTKRKGFPFEIPVPQGLAVSGAVLTGHMKMLDWRTRGVQFICALPDEFVEKVVKEARLFLA